MSDNLARVLVTGGSGFIGSHLCSALTDAGVDWINLDIAPPRIGGHAACWRELNLLDQAGVEKLVADYKPTTIYNLAAHASLSGDASPLLVNTKGCDHLISAARRAGLAPLIVHTSTQLVARPGYQPRDRADFAPYSVYGQSKAQSEEIFYSLADDSRWVIVRPTNVWGPRHPTFGDAIWKYIAKRLYLHPSHLDTIRSYGFVENVVYQLIQIARAAPGEVEGQTFYVGDEAISSTIWLDGFSVALTGRPVRRVPIALLRLAALGGEISGRLGGPSPINLGRLYRMTTDYEVPMLPTFNILGHGPVPFEEGVDRTVAWLKARATM